MHAHIWHYDKETCDFRFDPEFYPTNDSAHRRIEDNQKPGLVMLCENNPGPTSAECPYFILHDMSPEVITRAEFHQVHKD